MYKKICSNMRAVAAVAILLTTVFVLLACYNFFDVRLRGELKNEAIVLAEVLNEAEDSIEILRNIQIGVGDKKISLIGADGAVIYDNIEQSDIYGVYSQRQEIIQAKDNGIGISEKMSDNLLKKIYCCAVLLDNDNILQVSVSVTSVFEMLLRILVPILVIIGFVYIIIVVLSVLLTEKITKSINSIDLTSDKIEGEVYEEIRPLLRRIEAQNTEIKRQMKKVRTQKNRIQILSDSMNEGFILLDNNKNIISVNNSALEIFKTMEEDILYRDVYRLTQNKEILQSLEKAYCGEKTWLSVEIATKPFEIFFSPIKERNVVTSVIMLVLDVYEKQKAQKLRQEFTANVSHELKTPLTTIQGYTQIINQGIAKQEDIKGFTERILKETTRLITLVDDIMKLSKLDENKQNTDRTFIKLADVAEEVREMLMSKAGEHNISIVTECDESTIKGDLSQITELLYNLTDNAVKYNKDNGKVTISVKDKCLSVKDTGIGIPQEYHERIYERFFRVDKSRSKKTGGTGLGLSIVKHIAMCHDASIEVNSVEGSGTQFVVNFN